MLVSPSMGLTQWDQPNDIFSYTTLSNNFGLIDAHDHTSGKGVQIPNGGIANLAVDTTKIADSAVITSKIANLAVDTTKLADNSVTSGKISGTLANSKLTSPMTGAYRTIASMTGMLVGGSTVTTYVVGQDGTLIASSLANTKTPFIFPITVADHAVSGLATKFRIKTLTAVNATGPGVNFDVGVAIVSSYTGASGQLSVNAGSFLNSYTITALGANTITRQNGSDFNIAADNNLEFIVSPAGTTAAASMVAIGLVLQVHNV